MSDTIEAVQQALIKVINDAFGTTWAGRIAWENTAFTQPKNQPWMGVFFLPASERIATLGKGGFDEAKGLFQINLQYPVGAGEGESRKTINLLRTCFSPGYLQYGGQSVKILARQRGTGRSSNDTFTIPFTVRWKAQLNRNT